MAVDKEAYTGCDYHIVLLLRTTGIKCIHYQLFPT
jgi:hypothetical protein